MLIGDSETQQLKDSLSELNFCYIETHMKRM